MNICAVDVCCSGGSWAACTISTVNARLATRFALSGTGGGNHRYAGGGCDAVLNLLTNDSVTLSYTAASFRGNPRHDETHR
jgi:hypothetical protein